MRDTTSGFSTKDSPRTGPPPILPRKNSPSAPENSILRPFWVCRANYFADGTQPRDNCETTITTAHPSTAAIETNNTSAATDAGQHETTITNARPQTATVETNNTSATADTSQHETTITNARPQTATVETTITSATENHSKNAHFSPAKATPVSIPRRRKRAKATPVSDHRAASPAAPKRGPSGRRGLAAVPRGQQRHHRPHISHVIYRGHFSRHPKNVAIPTMQIQCLNASSRNYVRNQ